MSDQPKHYKNVAEFFHDTVTPAINQHTRTYIVAIINHNGESQVQMNGSDLDMPWLLKLADLRLNELLASNREIKCDDF